MDLYLKNGRFTSVNQIKDPPADLVTLSGSSLGIGINAAGGNSSTRFNVRITNPNGANYVNHTHSYTRVYRHAYWSYTWGIPNISGEWQVEIISNGTVMATKTFIR